MHSGLNMLNGPILATFSRYSLPWALALLLSSSASVVDGFFIGRHIGAMGLAALNITLPLFSLFMGLGIVLASGGSVRCAWYRGQGKEEQAQAMFTKTIVALLAVSLSFTLICIIWLKPIVLTLGANQEVLPLAMEYLQIILPFFPIFALEIGLSYFVRIDERPVLASLGLMSSALINIIFDYILIAKFNMGLTGAAWATGLGYVFSFAMILLAHFIYNKKPHLHLTRHYGRWTEVWQAAWNGISEMINELSTGTVVLITNIIMMQRLGAYGVAAFTVINYMIWFCLMMSYGISDSLGPLISANHGAKQPKRVQAFLQAALLSIFGLGLICFAIMSFFPKELIHIFLPKNTPANQLAFDFMYIVRFMFIFCGVNIVFTAYFTGLLKASASALLASLRSLILPVALLITLPDWLGETGIFLALPIAEAITLITALWLYKKIGYQKLISNSASKVD